MYTAIGYIIMCTREFGSFMSIMVIKSLANYPVYYVRYRTETSDSDYVAGLDHDVTIDSSLP